MGTVNIKVTDKAGHIVTKSLDYTVAAPAVNGRGAWNNAGVGGTKAYLSTNPGPYYYIGTGYNANLTNINEFMVQTAVKIYQTALNEENNAGLGVDGKFGNVTSAAVKAWQTKTGVTAWGGIGPETSKSLLFPKLSRYTTTYKPNALITSTIVSGIIKQETNWDAGAVGYSDLDDLGLVQINGRAHPELTLTQKVWPVGCYKFVIDYLASSLSQLNNNLRDAIASYNLGVAGARNWIAAGRPDFWQPSPTSSLRNIKGYIDTVLAG